MFAVLVLWMMVKNQVQKKFIVVAEITQSLLLLSVKCGDF